MNLSPNPSETFSKRYDFGTLRDPRHYVQRLRVDKVGFKEKIVKIYDFPQTTHALSNRVGEKAFFEENENKLIQNLYLVAADIDIDTDTDI